MFGYVRPSAERLNQEEQERFATAYCGLCHTLQRRYGFFSRMILNYDLTFLAILLEEEETCHSCERRCVIHPLRKRPCSVPSAALDTAADYSIILTWWQLRDGVTDSGFWKGMKYRILSRFLRRAYRKARAMQPDFDERTRRHLEDLAALERARCESLDRPADTFAQLLAGAADRIDDSVRRRVLQQMFYHLGRWIYLTDAADDLEKDIRSGSYNPLALRFSLEEGKLTQESRQELAATMDRSVEQMAAAFELLDFGQRSGIIRSVVYEGLYAVGGAVLNGTFRKRPKREERNLTRKAGP